MSRAVLYFIAKHHRDGNSAQHLPMLAHCKHSLNMLTFQFISLSCTSQTRWNGFAIHGAIHALSSIPAFVYAETDACVQKTFKLRGQVQPQRC